MVTRRKLTDNLKRVRDRTAAACARSGRRVEDVRLVAVSKTVEVDVIRAVIEIGMLDLGESRVQELIKRAGMIHEYLTRRRKMGSGDVPRDPWWHMVGHLQRNKVRMLLPWVDTIHSLDSLRLAEEISTEAARIGKTLPLLIEVNIVGEKSRLGVAVAAVSHLAEHIVSLPGIQIIGLMGMAPLVDDAEKARPVFARLREIFDEIRGERFLGPSFRELSMGMTNDFEVAIEEGATMIRLGRALFDGVV